MIERPKLRLGVRGISNGLWGEDLAIAPKEKRTWGTSSYLWLWVAMSVSIPTYMLAGSLIAKGMSWRQALGTILVGGLIVLLPMLGNAHAGAKYGIPFPVYLRASFGVLGAHVPAMLRALVASGWFGIQCWIGGQALFRGARIVLPNLREDAVWFCFAAIWLLNVAIVWRGVETIKSSQIVRTSLLLIGALALLFWMVDRTGGFGVVLLSHSEKIHAINSESLTKSDLWKIFVPSLTGVVGFWAAIILNISDYTRRARSQKAQMAGQAIGMLAAMMLCSFLAIAVTAATVIVTPDHRAIWNPIELVANIHQPMFAVVGLAVIVLATLNMNLAANGTSPAKAFSSLRPNAISFRVGTLITGALGVAWMPWRLMTDPDGYLSGWLVGSSGLLGPIAAIMIVDYFVIRSRSLDVDELYVRGGAYEYRAGFNPPAMVALASGIVVALIGLFVPPLHWLYECAWFAGFAVAALVYLALMSSPDVRAMIPPNPLLIPVDGFEPESPMA